jgi:hypothetical protein
VSLCLREMYEPFSRPLITFAQATEIAKKDHFFTSVVPPVSLCLREMHKPFSRPQPTRMFDGSQSNSNELAHSRQFANYALDVPPLLHVSLYDTSELGMP